MYIHGEVKPESEWLKSPSRFGTHALRGLLDQCRDILWLRHVDRVASRHLDERSARTLGHHVLRGRGNHPIFGRNE